MVLTISWMHVVLGFVLMATEPKLWHNFAREAGLAGAVIVAILLS